MIGLVLNLYPMETLLTDKVINDSLYNENRYNLLIVDDHQEILNLLKESLIENYNVFIASSGEEALKKLQSIPLPHLIISDVMMNKMDGHQFYLKIQKKEKFKAIPFIFLTAKTTLDEKIKGINKVTRLNN